MTRISKIREVWIIRGLKRSGNHAILSWIAKQGDFRVFNNVIPIVSVLKGHIDLSAIPTFTQWWHLNNKERKDPLSRIRYFFSRRYILLVSLEDLHLSQMPFTEITFPIRNILIVRDPNNMFASRIRKSRLVDSLAYPRHLNNYMSYITELWKEYAREFLEQTTTLDNKICIYFNEWHSNPDYRKDVASSLGLTFSDEGIRTISSTGGGSSFDGQRILHPNETLNVLDRTSQLDSNERALLDAVLNDSQITELNKAISSRIRSQLKKDSLTA